MGGRGLPGGCPVIAVTNRQSCHVDFLEQVARIAQARPRLLILREKDLPEPEYTVLAQQCSSVCRRYGTPLAVNHFIGIASKLQIPFLELSLHEFLLNRDTMGQFERVGVSVHSAAEALQAYEAGADFLIAGHIFPTDCKKGLPPRGLDFLREVCAAVPLPVFGIGGISPANFPQLLQVGAAGGCIMSGLMRADDPGAYLRACTHPENGNFSEE